MTPSELAQAAQLGDTAAFSALMNMHYHRLYRIARAYLRDEEDTLEVIQEATYRAYSKLKSLRKPEMFGSWITRILLNCCAREYRHRQKFRPLPMQDLHEQGSWDHPEDPDLAAAIDALSHDHKQVIILSYFEGLSLTETAVILGIPAGTVKSRLHRALGQLRKQLDIGGDDSDD
ncbi:RNA polymerase sigma factor SigV [compost metagenome]